MTSAIERWLRSFVVNGATHVQTLGFAGGEKKQIVRDVRTCILHALWNSVQYFTVQYNFVLFNTVNIVIVRHLST